MLDKKEIESANASHVCQRTQTLVLHGLSNPREHFIVMHTGKKSKRNKRAKSAADIHFIVIDSTGSSVHVSSAEFLSESSKT